MTRDSLTIVINGKATTVVRGAPNFEALRKAILAKDDDAVKKNLTVETSIQNWSKGKFKINGDTVLYDGKPVSKELNERIISTASAGGSPEPLFKFWEKLQKNPNPRSVEQLWAFLRHQGIPINENGNFYAYKGVRGDYKDKHSGRFSNVVGAVHEMDRNLVSSDPQHACHVGFHVGSLSYASGFGEVLVVCEVDPADVVCIPYDENAQKMRVCRYRVIGEHNGEYLPSTTYELEGTELFPGGKATRKDKKRVVKKVRSMRNYREMGTKELLGEMLHNLRWYATHILKMTGASKIPGGKVPLVAQIMKIHRQKNRLAEPSKKKKRR
jgi:hypothetical protein